MTGRRNWFLSTRLEMSEAMPASSRAATRGIMSLPIEDAVAVTTPASFSRARRTTMGA
jgi:hypothetical protein